VADKVGDPAIPLKKRPFYRCFLVAGRVADTGHQHTTQGVAGWPGLCKSPASATMDP